MGELRNYAPEHFVNTPKALAEALGRVNVVDKSGNKVDLEALRPQTPPVEPTPAAE